ncbi:hypothetical protein lerEdw1_020897 [Lerista edwardsae]|nr:hypothetical protein lerEdw1_020897 [Lerista edwardsae]
MGKGGRRLEGSRSPTHPLSLLQGVKTSDALQEAKVNLLDIDKCNSSGSYNGAMTPHTLCAGYQEGGIDSCQLGVFPLKVTWSERKSELHVNI